MAQDIKDRILILNYEDLKKLVKEMIHDDPFLTDQECAERMGTSVKNFKSNYKSKVSKNKFGTKNVKQSDLLAFMENGG